MTNAIIEFVKEELAELEGNAKPAVKAVEKEAHALESAAWTYIKTNGLTDLYNIALTVLAAASTDAPWSVTLATVAAQATTDGVKIIKGTEALVAAQAQADLLSKGAIAAPVAAVDTTKTVAALPAV